MGLKSDSWIRKMSLEHGMITPFEEKLVRAVDNKRVVSYGVSSAGYDIRVNNKFKVCDQRFFAELDVKQLDDSLFIDVEAERLIIPPHGFVLAESVETFRMPPDTLGLAIGKSTYARVGLVTNITPLEPGWSGILTIELSNTSPLPVAVYAGEGICQVLFFQTDDTPEVNYAQRSGKYNNQTGITLPKV
ncbi:MAG: dCTP deaminase [Anaerolineae bacterium]|nr:dCTP deaminase [Anaerolineae bacterium]